MDKSIQVHVCFEHNHPEIGDYWFVLNHMKYDLNDVNWNKARELSRGRRFGYVPVKRMRSKKNIETKDVTIMS